MNWHWLIAPERLLTYFLFFLALYRTELRSWLDRSVLASGHIFRAGRANKSSRELADLTRIHENVYELVLFLAYEVVGVIVWTIWAAIIVGIVMYVLVSFGKISQEDLKLTPILWPLFVAMSITKIRDVWRILSGLYQYERRVAKLTAVIEAGRPAPSA